MKQMSRCDIYALAVLVWFAVGNVCYVLDSGDIEWYEDTWSYCTEIRDEWASSHNAQPDVCATVMRPITLWMEVYMVCSFFAALSVGFIMGLMWSEPDEWAKMHS